MVAWLWLLTIGCGDEPPPDTSQDTEQVIPEVVDDGLVELETARLLRRMSLDLRGVLPSLEELATVEEDPEQLNVLRDSFLEDPRLEARLVSFFAERFHTRLDTFEVLYVDYRLSDEQECEFERSVGEEPLRLMSHVVVQDQPWTDIVTVDYTLATEVLGEVWPLDYPEDTSGWAISYYNDGRPAAGILATNGLWWRYVTSEANGNRARAAALSRLLLCEALLARPVNLAETPGLADEEATASALRENEYCLGCHSTIEPLAASMFGFYPAIQYNPEELGYYHPEREPLGEIVLGVSPAYFGTPIAGLIELGDEVAKDSRFIRCAAETAATMLWRRNVELDDFNRVEAFRQDFVDKELQFKALLQSVTNGAVYRASEVDESVTDTGIVGREITQRMVTPDQFVTLIEDLTGFYWEYINCDQLGNDDYGYRTLAGGVDGYDVFMPQLDAGLTWALVVKRLSQAAAVEVVVHDLVNDADEKTLFQYVTLENEPGDAKFSNELNAIYLRMFATTPDDETIDALETLWSNVNSLDDAAAAWVAVLSVLIRDPDFVTY